MTTPGQPQPLVDMGNPLLAHVPAQLDTGTVDLPGEGKFGVMTIRTGSTTLTVMLAAVDLKNWAGVLAGLAEDLGGGLVKASPLDMTALDMMHPVGPKRRQR